MLAVLDALCEVATGLLEGVQMESSCSAMDSKPNIPSCSFKTKLAGVKQLMTFTTLADMQAVLLLHM